MCEMQENGCDDVEGCVVCMVWLKVAVLCVGLSCVRLRSLRWAAEVRRQDCVESSGIFRGEFNSVEMNADGASSLWPWFCSRRKANSSGEGSILPLRRQDCVETSEIYRGDVNSAGMNADGASSLWPWSCSRRKANPSVEGSILPLRWQECVETLEIYRGDLNSGEMTADDASSLRPWSCSRRKANSSVEGSILPLSTVGTCGRNGVDRRGRGRKGRSLGRRDWKFWNFGRSWTFVKIWRKQEAIHQDVHRLDDSLGRVLQRVERCGAVDDVQDVERGGGGQAVESPTIEPTMASPVEPKGQTQWPCLELMPPSLRPPITCPNSECGLIMSRDGVKEPLNYCPLCGTMLPQGCS